MTFTAGLALALSAVLGGSTVSLTPAQMPQAQTVEQYIDTYFADEPVMIAIAQCESHFEQYDDDGNVLKNPKSTAVGVFQIMSSIHGSIADDKLGYDINTLEGNAAYAKYLYENQGTAPWASSKSCWSKSPAAKAIVADAQ